MADQKQAVIMSTPDSVRLPQSQSPETDQSPKKMIIREKKYNYKIVIEFDIGAIIETVALVVVSAVGLWSWYHSL